MARIDLIDLTPEIQNPVDWKKVANAGFRGAYIKCTQYSSSCVPGASYYAARAMSEGLAAGFYHFAYVGADPVIQARFFASEATVNGVLLGSRPGDMPPMLDLEYVRDWKSFPPQAVVVWAEKFMAEAERIWGREPVLYTYPWFGGHLQPYLKNSSLTKYPLCMASYRADWDPLKQKSVFYPWYPKDTEYPPTLDGFMPPLIWQYSGNNGIKVPGIAQDCDRDLFMGDEDMWREFIGSAPRIKDSMEFQKNSF